MITLGITGRSGCGKSTVTNFFAAQGVPCADADRIARGVLSEGSPILPLIAARFGADLFAGGTLDRKLLAQRAFASPEATQALNAITHPEILRCIRAQQEAARQAGAALFCVDAPVLFGTALEPLCSRVLVVTAPEETLLARICARDGISRAAAQQRLAAQLPEAELVRRADYVLHNDTVPADAVRQAQAVFELLRKEP